MGLPPKIKKEEPESPSVPLSLNNNDDELVRNFTGITRPNPNPVMPPPNEQLYSSLYGREMEMMRKMFKNNDDRLDNSMMLGANPANIPKGFHPTYPNIFPANNPKYFEPTMMRFDSPPPEKMRKHDPKATLYPIGHPLFTNRQTINPINTNNSQLYDDVVHGNKHQGLLKPLFDDKPHPHFNVNFNSKTETSLTTKSYPGFDNSLPNNDNTTNHNNLLLSESQFVSHNFNVNNYTNRSDKSQSTFLNNRGGNHSPSDFVNATNNNSSEFDLNKSGDNNVVGLIATQLKVTSHIKCTDATKEFGNGNVSVINFDDDKSRNSSNDNDDDEFTNL